MKRLLDQVGNLDASEQALAELFASAPKYKPDPFRKRRVLVKVVGSQSSKTPRILRGALITTLLGITATAAAVVGDVVPDWLGGGASEADETVEPAQMAAPPAPVTPRAAPAETPTAEDEAATEPEPPAATTAAPSPRSAPKPAERTRGKSSEDPTQVLEAMRALRAEHDPKKAQGLLSDYMKKHPNGVLAEDALALSIEAATARRDPAAKDYARRYLSAFPNGRYKALATRALER